MKNNIKEPIIYLLKITLNYIIGIILNIIFSKNGQDFSILYSFGFILISMAATSIVSKKLNYTLDLHSNNYIDDKHLVLNSLLIGDLLSIVVIMFINGLF